MKEFGTSTRTLPLILLTLALCCASSVGKSRIETIQFHSTLVNKTLPYSVVLPAEYDTSPVARYPVLYLLHGLWGHYTDWLARTNIAEYAAAYRLIIVTPEGNDSWYIDSAT